MEDYFRAKSLLFTEALSGKWLSQTPEQEPISVINLDDAYGKRLMKMAYGKKIGYGVGNSDADYKAKIIEHNWDGIRISVCSRFGEIELKSPLLGRVNAHNIVAAACTLLELGVKPEAIVRGVETLKSVPGRMERVDNKQGFLVLVDYAHTPDALEKTILSVKDLGIRRLILVFGCGGDRDRSKRPRMGEIGARSAQILIVTSDNPRTEDPLKIISEIEMGVEKTGVSKINHINENKKGYIIEPDRRKAIEMALKLAREGDAVLIAGKGHEDYQIIGTEKIHFDDREEVRRILGAGLYI
jgi:UDP-N-acetylmuramoyl-L-alanyl-D-glutamate--2,6-diaminopimelate ligase